MTEQRETKTFARNFGITLSGDAVTVLFTFINSIFVARLLGPEGRGEYAVLISLAEITSLLLSAGIYWGITYWLGKKPDFLPKLLGSAAIHLIMVIGFCVIIGLSSVQTGFSWTPNVAPVNVILLMIVIPLVVASEMLRFFFLGMGLIRHYTSIGVFRIVAWTTLNVIVLGMLDSSATGAMMAWLTQLVLTVVFFTTILIVRNKPSIGIDRHLYWNVLQNGAKGLVTQLGSRLMYSGDIYFLNFLLPVGVLGNYSVATSAVRVMQRSANVAGTLIFPLSARRHDSEVDRLTARVTRHLVFLNVCLSIVIFVVGRTLLTLAFGPEYESSYALLAWLLPGFIAVAPPIVIGPYLWGQDYPWIVLVAPYAAFALNIGLLFLTTPLFGPISASIASSAAYIFWSVLLINYFHRHTELPLRDILIIKQSDLLAIGRMLLSRLLALRASASGES